VVLVLVFLLLVGIERNHLDVVQALRVQKIHKRIDIGSMRTRPSRSPDFAAENRALVALAQVMAGSPDRILQKLVETALLSNQV
jgi:hypothetical protein